jgi:pSer/pThr/pTyr-binding forkhead associated (FHA) protein
MNIIMEQALARKGPKRPEYCLQFGTKRLPIFNR